MAIERGFRAKLRYRSDEFLSGGAGRQLLFLFVLTLAIVVVFSCIGLALEEHKGTSFLDRAWFYFARTMDAGTMGGDEGNLNRFVSSVNTILGVIVAGLLISSLAGNFQERLESIRQGGSPVMEQGHFLILGWSEKIYSVIDQISEAYAADGRIVAVVLADREKLEMERKLRDKIVYQKRIKLVVRSGSPLNLTDLARVSFDHARAVVVLLDENDVDDPNKADGRVIKTLLALFNHPDAQSRADSLRVTAEVMLPQSQDIALIASGGRAKVIKTNEIISKMLLQTSRISGLSLVYDELLRFEGNEIHFHRMPQLVGRQFGDVLLDFTNGCLVGVAKQNGASHILNPPAEYVIQPDDDLLILAEDENITYSPYQGPLQLASVQVPGVSAKKPVEHLLVLGYNEKIFPIIDEYDSYVGSGSTLTLVNSVDEKEHAAKLAECCKPPKNIQVRHLVGEFTSRALMERVQPQNYPTVMVLGDAAGGGGVEEADTRAIIALLLLRDFRQRAQKHSQEVCSEILDPKNRDLAATTEIHDIVISNEMVSMVLAQITYEPRVRPVLEDLFESEGSEIYLKNIGLYLQPGQTVTFEYLMLAAKRRGEVALGIQIYEPNPKNRYGVRLNPDLQARRTPFTPRPKDRLIVLAEDDG